ncbi:MAG: hypothetical protein F6K26_42865 [Moorea sp. SIO2I5]|nr:hypothetical protein [Moorena sp. SIO2I5]
MESSLMLTINNPPWPKGHAIAFGCATRIARLPDSGLRPTLRERPSRSTFNIQPSTSNLQHPTFNIKPSTSNLQHQTFNIKPSTSNLQHQTFNIQPSTSNLQHQTFNIS